MTADLYRKLCQHKYILLAFLFLCYDCYDRIKQNYRQDFLHVLLLIVKIV